MFRCRICATQFDAVYLAIGAQKPKELEIPGADLRGVFHALPFLIQKNLDETLEGPPIDVEGNASRSWAEATRRWIVCGPRFAAGRSETVCIYRRDLENMPGSRREYINATEEGARFMFLTNPIALSGNDNGAVAQKRAACAWNWASRTPKAAANRSAIPGSEFEVPVDVVLIAFGFDPVPIFPAGNSDKIEVNKWGGVVVDANQMTSVPGVFAGGDLVRGPDLVVRAVRDSRKAAAAIHQYFSSENAVRP